MESSIIRLKHFFLSSVYFVVVGRLLLCRTWTRPNSSFLLPMFDARTDLSRKIVHHSLTPCTHFLLLFVFILARFVVYFFSFVFAVHHRIHSVGVAEMF